jgi:serine/threonine-protein kinase HipA
MTDATVRLWGRDIGAVSWLADREIGVFQYAPEFVGSNIEVAPLMMPLREAPYEFPELPRAAFKGLPGLLADSLPDKFGNALIDAWLASQGRRADSFNPVERLCYIGTRGMGALEFQPSIAGPSKQSRKLEVAALVELANRVLDERLSAEGKFTDADEDDSLEDIIKVGTSAGGARAKAIISWNEQSGEFRSGQVPAGEGFSYWLMKFDGVVGNRDKELADPQGYGLIEYAYHLMALEAGITMMPSRVHYENGRSHFMTQRFDRTEKGAKLHVQSLCALMHYDFNQPDAYSYEQAMQAMLRLGLSMIEIEEQFRRAVFNVLARNQDDHVKNIAYVMDKAGNWRLSPAFDITYSYNPTGAWTGRHQMSINGKRDNFALDDLIALGRTGGIKKTRVMSIVEQVKYAVRQWERFATEAGVDGSTRQRIARAHRDL